MIRREQNLDGDVGDADLRSRFAELRQEEERRAGQFTFPWQSMVSREPGWSLGRAIAVVACLATMVGAAALWIQSEPGGERSSDSTIASLTQWHAPTDFLLETPGRDLLRSVPAIGKFHDYTETSLTRKQSVQK